MNFDAFKRELAIHYAEMASLPGAIDHARHQVLQLQRAYPREFADLGELVKQEVNRERK